MSKYALLGGMPYFQVIAWIDSDNYPLPDPLPENIVPISEEIYQTGGSWSYHNGEVVQFYYSLWNEKAMSAITALEKADITMIRTLSAGLVVPQEWLEFKVSLRDYLKLPRDFYVTPTEVPERPPYPVGS